MLIGVPVSRSMASAHKTPQLENPTTSFKSVFSETIQIPGQFQGDTVFEKTRSVC